MAKYVKIEVGRTSNESNEYEFQIVRREAPLEAENARLREENHNLKLQVEKLMLSSERLEACPVCHNQLRNSQRGDGAICNTTTAPTLMEH
jgi:DNA repair exonuclease SbcCD ATPase subunit